MTLNKMGTLLNSFIEPNMVSKVDLQERRLKMAIKIKDDYVFIYMNIYFAYMLVYIFVCIHTYKFLYVFVYLYTYYVCSNI
jgi:hypothetical protein